jgi:hypothetical protein
MQRNYSSSYNKWHLILFFLALVRGGKVENKLFPLVCQSEILSHPGQIGSNEFFLNVHNKHQK